MPLLPKFGSLTRAVLRPDLPHEFQPRKRGTPLACDVCGATERNEIHTPAKGKAT